MGLKTSTGLVSKGFPGALTAPTTLPESARIAGFFVLMALAAQAKVPLPWTDVPLTLQLPAMLLGGMVLSPCAAAAAMGLYLGAGFAGLPVFAPGSAGLYGPTGGYLVGLLLGAFFVSVVSGRTRDSFARLLLAGAAGMAVLFACGFVGRVLWFGAPISWVVSTGVAPFALKAGVEVLFIACLIARWNRTGSRA